VCSLSRARKSLLRVKSGLCSKIVHGCRFTVLEQDFSVILWKLFGQSFAPHSFESTSHWLETQLVQVTSKNHFCVSDQNCKLNWLTAVLLLSLLLVKDYLPYIFHT